MSLGEGLSAILASGDDGRACQDLARSLRAAGFRVAEAATWRAVLEQAASRPDLIVLADELPDLDRSELLGKLRGQAAAASPVLVLPPATSEPPGAVAALIDCLKAIRGDAWGPALDALADGVALLDPRGTVLRCNRAMGELLGRPLDEIRGANFIALTAAYPRRLGDRPFLLARRTRRRESAEWDVRGRCCRITADPLADGDAFAGAVVVLSPLPDPPDRCGDDEGREAPEPACIEQLEREARLVQGLVGAAAAPVGLETLRRRDPDSFCELLGAYERALDLAYERTHYHVELDVSGALFDMAARLGACGAGPRDVVEIHGTALRRKGGGAAASKARAYADEGRILVLELMGHLANFYRSLVVPPIPQGRATPRAPAR